MLIKGALLYIISLLTWGGHVLVFFILLYAVPMFYLLLLPLTPIFLIICLLRYLGILKD